MHLHVRTWRLTNAVDTESFADASRNASRAISSLMPSISNSTLPGRTLATQYSTLPLPLPMRTSSGFWVIGTSGKTRIQIRPPRFTWREMARRAASISRAVIRQRSVAFRPYSPNATKLPRCALPEILPLNCLRNLVRFGCIMCRYLGAISTLRRRRRLDGFGACRRCSLGLRLGCLGFRLIEDFAFEYPNLDADHAIGRLRLGKSVVDVRTEGVQRHAPFAIGLRTRDFRPVQAARNAHFDAQCARTHGIGHGALHGAAEHHTLLELLRDTLGDQLRVEFGL